MTEPKKRRISDLLPVHPQPNADELFSSWLVRLSVANKYKPHRFLSKLVGYKGAVWNRDIDRTPNPVLIQKLSASTGLSASSIEGLTLQEYIGVIFDRLDGIGIAPWLLPVGVYCTSHKRAGIQYCPLCLQDNPPYYRKCWRLSFYVICERHGCILFDRCPACSSEITFQRNLIGYSKTVSLESICFCHRCHFDLRQSEPEQPSWSDETSVSRLRYLFRDILSGNYSAGLDSVPFPLSFLLGLRVLTKCLVSRHTKFIQDNLDRIQNGLLLPERKKTGFDYLTVKERLNCLILCMWLISDWPMRFELLTKNTKLTRGFLILDIKQFPFWLSNYVDIKLDKRRYTPNCDELRSCRDHLLRCGITPNRQSLSKLLGIHACTIDGLLLSCGYTE